jgi:hypothetical protein
MGLSNRARIVKPFLAKPLYAMAAVARPGRGGALSAAALPELRGAPGRCGRPDRTEDGVAERRQGLNAAAPLRDLAGFASSVRGRRVPGSRLSPRSVRDRRMMGLRGIGLPRYRARSETAAGPSAEWPRPRPRQGRPKCPTTAGTRERVGQLMACTPDEETSMRDQGAAEAEARASKLVPVFHIACRITASLRASATAARLKPRRFFSAKPQLRSVLSACTCVRIDVAAS